MKITDVFAFATQNPDYWKDFFSSDKYPSELTDEETRALDGAREHIEAVAVELLHAAGAELAAKIGPKALAPPRFRPSITARNRRVSLGPPAGLESKLYRVVFGLDPSESGERIQLYATLVVKKGSLDVLRANLDKKAVPYSVENYYLYGPSVPLIEGDEVTKPAEEAAVKAAELLRGFDT